MSPAIINVVGDLMVGGDFSRRAAELIPKALPADARELLSSGITLANLEAGFSNRGEGTPNKILVYALPESAGVLGYLGIDAVNLANNHVFDYGLEGVRDTIAVLESLGIGWFGAGGDLDEASRPWVTETESGRVAAVGFSWTDQWVQPAPAATDNAPGVNPIDPLHIERTIKRIVTEHAPDTLIVSLHWGEGMSRYPRPDAVQLARSIVRQGADIVMGHHPHCLQPYEITDDGVIFYSLGNLIASRYTKSPAGVLTYDQGVPRGRTLRERLTAVATVELDSAGLRVSHMPLVQDGDEAVLLHPEQTEAAIVARVFRENANRFGRGYRFRYWFLRRGDELVSKVEEIREFGWGSLSWRTPWRALRRLITGRNMH